MNYVSKQIIKITIVFACLLILNIADYHLTATILSQVPGAIELNPIMRTIIDTYGFQGMAFAKTIILLTAGTVITYAVYQEKFYAIKIGLNTTTIMYGIVVGYSTLLLCFTSC